MSEKLSLLDKVAEREKKEAEQKVKTETEQREIETTALNKITSRNDGSKDKQISAKVNEKVYEQFTNINRAMGLSNNSAINMIINKYVRENKGILDFE